ncbi:Protein SKR-1 protein, partial [Aphelenchoides avenae]
MALSTAASNAARTRIVRCKTADDQHILVGLDVLRLSHAFADMYDDLGLGEHEDFPEIVSVRNVDLRVFIRVIDWCVEHKGEAEPIVEKDAFTQEEEWFEFSDFEQQFLSVPVPELLELIEAADYLGIRIRQILHQTGERIEVASFLDIRNLYEYGRRAVGALIKGKRPLKARQFLHQFGNLRTDDIDRILACNPWLGSRAEFQDQFVDVPEPLYIPAEVLVKVFQKLPRDIERLQLVSRYFHDVIVKSSKLSEKRGPLRPVNVTLGLNLQDGHFVTPVGEDPGVICFDQESLGEYLKFCTVWSLRISWDAHDVLNDEVLASLGPLKPAWKNATVDVPLDCFSSKAAFEFAFTEVFICKKIRIYGTACFEPQFFMRLPAILHCNRLNASSLNHLLAVNDIVEWLERDKPERWDKPTYLEVHHSKIIEGEAELVEALKK